jgi:hypothetical protein
MSQPQIHHPSSTWPPLKFSERPSRIQPIPGYNAGHFKPSRMIPCPPTPKIRTNSSYRSYQITNPSDSAWNEYKVRPLSSVLRHEIMVEAPPRIIDQKLFNCDMPTARRPEVAGLESTSRNYDPIRQHNWYGNLYFGGNR